MGSGNRSDSPALTAGTAWKTSGYLEGAGRQSCDLGVEWEEKSTGENVMEKPVSVSILPNVDSVEPHHK